MTTTTVQIREILELREKNILSRYASSSLKSLGRNNFEEQSPMGLDFQIDRDRILRSKSFRRLKHKTQVFFAPYHDHFRTRLTHTLEVSQISRTISRCLQLNEDLTESIALGHDLGHTPFGHRGEEALNTLIEGGFHHSRQSVRVVTLLENMNLTKETIDGIKCHSFGKNEAFTLEGRVVKIADKIAYINHDIDDALRAGLIVASDLPKDCLKILGETDNERIVTLLKDIFIHSYDRPEVVMSEEKSHYMYKLRDWMFKNVYHASFTTDSLKKADEILNRLFDDAYTRIQSLTPSCDDGKIKRCIADYIASMSDRYAISVYEKKFDDTNVLKKYMKISGLVFDE